MLVRMKSSGCLIMESSLEFLEMSSGLELFRWIIGSGRVKMNPTSSSINFYPSYWYKYDSNLTCFYSFDSGRHVRTKLDKGIRFYLGYFLVIYGTFVKSVPNSSILFFSLTEKFGY